MTMAVMVTSGTTFRWRASDVRSDSGWSFPHEWLFNCSLCHFPSPSSIPSACPPSVPSFWSFIYAVFVDQSDRLELNVVCLSALPARTRISFTPLKDGGDLRADDTLGNLSARNFQRYPVHWMALVFLLRSWLEGSGVFLWSRSLRWALSPYRSWS